MSEIYKKGLKLRIIIFIVLTSFSCLGLLLAPTLSFKLIQECLGINVFYIRVFINGCGLLDGFLSFLLFFSIIYAWLVYFYMGYGWIFRRTVSNKWIFSGTLSALIPLATFIFFSFDKPKLLVELLLTSVGTAIPFACYLVAYHSKGNTRVIV